MPNGPRKAPAPRNYKTRPRPTNKQRGYGIEHVNLRKLLKAKFPVCQLCNAAFSTDLHHLDGNPHNRKAENCLMVCEACHHGKLHG